MSEQVKKNESVGFFQKNYDKKAIIQKLITSAFVNIFVTFTLFFFSPLEVFLGNTNEFIFSLGDVWWILFLFSFGAALALTLIAVALPKTVSLIFNAIVFALGIGAYVQSNFLNGSMGSLTGEGDTYSNTLVYVNLGVWIFIVIAFIVATVLVIKFKKSDIFKKGIYFVASALIAMQLTAFVVASFSTNGTANYFYLTDKGQYELANGKNTIIFIVDTCDGAYVDRLVKENPEALEGLDGFIYYPDAVTTHSRTYPSLPYLLTGEVCHFDKPYVDYVNDAHAGSSYLSDINSTGANIGLYTKNQYIGEANRQYVGNASDYEGNAKTSFKGTCYWLSRMSLYRNAPYNFKSVFTYTDQDVNEGCVSLPGKCYMQQDIELYNDMKKQGISTTDDYDKAFRLYHLWGAHPGGSFNRELEVVGRGNTDAYEAALGDFKLIREYIAEMKELGIYDDSTIIITTDHGLSKSTDDANPFEINRTVRGLMMVKPAGTEGKVGVTTNEAPVCHADLFATVIDSFDGNTEDYGKTIYEYKEGDERTRLYYHTIMFSDIDGEIVLREYAINGDSRDFNNWKLTGNNWDVLYSERAVSRTRFTDADK